MDLSTGALLKACRAALSHSFSVAHPDTPLDARGYLADARQNLIDGVRFEDIEADLLQGDGSELRGDGRGRPAKFLATHSSTALAVNVFGPFRPKPVELPMPWGRGFTTLQFERKCPHGVGNGKPPNLDVLPEGTNQVVGIESKFMETIGRHKAEFKPAYDADLRGGRRETPWFYEMQRLMANAETYRWLNASQLVKHALGLSFSFPGRASTLAYVFWEPRNALQHRLFAEHRAELERFSASVAGGLPQFVWMSYPELWTWWDGLQDAPEWLRVHVDRLRERYSFDV
jgi:hypothetical protein